MNGFSKTSSISSPHTDGHPVVVPMVTALNHAVADGRRAGGLNLSSSILTGREGEREAGKGALLPEATAFSGAGRCPSPKKINHVRVRNALTLLFQRKPEKNAPQCAKERQRFRPISKAQQTAGRKQLTRNPQNLQKRAFLSFYNAFAMFNSQMSTGI